MVTYKRTRPTDEPKTATLFVRVTPSERQTLKLAAQTLGKTESQYVMDVLLENAKRIVSQ